MAGLLWALTGEEILSMLLMQMKKISSWTLQSDEFTVLGRVFSRPRRKVSCGASGLQGLGFVCSGCRRKLLVCLIAEESGGLFPGLQ